jgi:excinuclease UvrABC nuclease subunit
MTPAHDIEVALNKDRQEIFDAGVNNRSGCYGFFKGDECLYIGQALFLIRRVVTHMAMANDEITLRVWLTDKLDTMETLLIKELRPRNNVLVKSPRISFRYK